MTDKEEPTSEKKSTLKVISSDPKPERKKNDGQKRKEIHFALVMAMLRDRFSRWPQFPVKLHRWTDDKGQSLIYEENDKGIVRLVCEEQVDALIADYWEEVGREGTWLGTVTAEDVAKTRRLWLMKSPARSEPFPLVTWASDPRPAHHKLPFDPMYSEEIHTPLFDELMGRTSNSKALMAFIGSIMDEKSQRQQYAWIYGGGQNGKGAIVRCLSRLFGKVYGSEEPPTGDSKHWTSGLLGKRLIVFADCNNASFVTTGRFKSLTGEDKIRVEIKNGPVLAVDILAKYLFTSNEKPSISSTTADLRRIIYSFIKPVEDKDLLDNYEELLDAEVPGFISACWYTYQIVTGGKQRKTIKTENDEEVKELAENSEHEFEAFVDEYLRFDRDGAKEPKFRHYTRATPMLEAMSAAGFRGQYERKKLRDYLERKHGISCRPNRMAKDGNHPTDTVLIRCWLGVLLLKDQPPIVPPPKDSDR